LVGCEHPAICYLRPGATTSRFVPSLPFLPASTVSSARAPQACCILQPIMGFTAFLHSDSGDFLIGPGIAPGYRSPLLLESFLLSRSVRPERTNLGPPSEGFPSNAAVPVWASTRFWKCLQAAFPQRPSRPLDHSLSRGSLVRFGALHRADPLPANPITEVILFWAVPSRRCRLLSLASLSRRFIE
jgi:hypothetical protein